MARLGMPVSDTTILHSVKASAKDQPNGAVLRVVGIDEWAWRKGRNFGTVIVDLERRKVMELLADRTATSTADWFKRHPGIEIVSRGRDFTPRLLGRAHRRHGRLRTASIC
jgi:transposase